MARTNDPVKTFGTACALGLLAAATWRVAAFEATRRAAWQACARWMATTVETRRPPRAERWEGVLEPVEDPLPAVGKASAKLRLPARGVERWPGPVSVHGSETISAGAATLLAVPRCEPPGGNGTDRDFFAAFRLPTVRLAVRLVRPRRPEGLESVVDAIARFRERAGRRLRPWPRTFGVARAAWTGELGALPESWRVAFRDGGALAVVALSGQHVALVSGWFLAFLTFAGRFGPPGGFLHARLRALLPPAVAGAFVALGAGAPSTVRAAATVFATAIFRRRGLDVSGTRVAVVTAATTVIVQPAFVATPGYLLSVGGAVLIARALEAPSGARRAGAIAVLLPVALAPLVVYCFARLPLLAVVAGLLVGFFWEAIVLPLALFGAPVALQLGDRALAALAGAAESVLVAVERGLEAAAPWLASSVVVVPVPTPWELAAFYGALACCVGGRVAKRSRKNARKAG